MGKFDVLKEENKGYTLEQFLSKKDSLIYKTSKIIELNKSKLSRTSYKVRFDLNTFHYNEITYGIFAGVTVAISTLFLDKLSMNNSYALSIGGPLLTFGTICLFNRRLSIDNNNLQKDINLLQSIDLYNDFLDFLNGEDLSVVHLKEIDRQCKDDNFIDATLLLNNLYMEENDNKYLYAEELCVDYDMKNTSKLYIKRMNKR